MRQINGESIVLTGEEPSNFWANHLLKGSLEVRSKYDKKEDDCIIYQEEADYIVDYEQGTICRTKNSAIPDFSKNILFGNTSFNHNDFPGYGNKEYFVFLEYSLCRDQMFQIGCVRKADLKHTRVKLVKHQPITILIYGDSISTGAEATKQESSYFGRWAEYLSSCYQTEVNILNLSVGGANTDGGVKGLDGKDFEGEVDLAIVAFGMNDANRKDESYSDNAIPVGQYQDNVEWIIHKLRQSGIEDIVLVSPCWPNPNWMWSMNHTSRNIRQYSEALSFLAEKFNCGFANVTETWSDVLQRKKPEDLLGNNINHPNDFGHWIYFLTLKEVWL